MVKLKPGDRIDCRIHNATIVSPYREYDSILTFEIVAVDKYGYYLYVPPYIHLKQTFKADQYQCKHLEIEPQFEDTDIVYVDESMIYKVKTILVGLKCNKCKEFLPMAEPNREDGSVLCYSCRTNPYR